MDKNTQRIVEDVLLQAGKGKVQIMANDGNPWTFYTHFYTKIEDKDFTEVNNSHPIVFISNYKLFLEKIDKYLNTAKQFYDKDEEYFDVSGDEFLKKLFLDLMVSVGSYDLLDILKYIDKRQEILEHKQEEGKLPLGKYKGLKIFAKIKKNHSNLESPYRFDVIFKDRENFFQLPSILYGMMDDKVQLMGIQNFNKEEKNELSKKLDRFFRKANKDVDMDDDIAKISPNALVAFTVFCAYLQQNNVKDLNFSAFMPIRYYCQKEVGMNRLQSESEREEFLRKHDKNQYNMTDKVINMFLRYAHHFPASKPYYDHVRQQMSLSLSTLLEEEQDNIINDISSAVEEEKNQDIER